MAFTRAKTASSQRSGARLESSMANSSRSRLPAGLVWLPTNIELKAAAVLGALIIAGCGDAPSRPDVEAESDLSHLLRAHWSINQTLGPTVLAVEFALTTEADCLATAQVATRAILPGMASLVIGLDPQGQLMFAAPMQYETIPANIAIGGVQTQSAESHLVEGGGGGGGLLEPGNYTLMIIAPDVQPGPPDGVLAGRSLAFTIECDRPFQLIGARLGSSVALASEESLEADMRADVRSDAGFVVNGTLSLDAHEPEVYALFSDIAGTARNIRLLHPSGIDSWGPTDSIFPPPIIVDGAGYYEFDVTRFGSGRFWCAIFGVDGPFPLDRGTLDIQEAT